MDDPFAQRDTMHFLRHWRPLHRLLHHPLVLLLVLLPMRWFLRYRNRVQQLPHLLRLQLLQPTWLHWEPLLHHRENSGAECSGRQCLRKCIVSL